MRLIISVVLQREYDEVIYKCDYTSMAATRKDLLLHQVGPPHRTVFTYITDVYSWTSFH